MPTPLRRPGRERYEAILDAAVRCFAERGVARTGIEDVRRAAGASPSSVYHLFDGLEDIATVLLERTFTRLFEVLVAQVLPATTARAAVERLVRAHLEWVLANRDEARFMYEATAFQLGPEGAERLVAHKRRALAPLVDKLGRFAARGELPDWPPEELDIVLLGPAHEACRRLLAGAELDPGWLLEELPRVAWRAARVTSR